MSKVQTFALLGALMALIVGPSPALAQTKKITIGYASASDFLPAFIGKEKGCFEKQNLDVTLTRIPIVGNIPPALVAGSLQIGMSTATVLLQAVDGGLELTTVAGATRMLKDNPTISLVVRKDIQVKAAADLKGKKIGVPGINSVADVMFRKWLKNSGVNLADVTFIETPFPQMSDLLRAGTVDGVLAVEPIRSRIVNAGVGARIPEEYYVAVSPDSILAFWIATTAWAKANPDVITKLRGCLAEGIAFIKTNPEEAQAIEKQYLGFNSPVYPTMTASAKASDFRFFVDLAREFGLVRKNIDVNTLVVP
jgi:NitT/TauT family transport system substrate-binding protein